MRMRNMVSVQKRGGADFNAPLQVYVSMAATALPEGWERSETTSGIPYYLK